MPHYFAKLDKQNYVIFDSDTTHHLKNVLRVKLNEEIKAVIDNNQYLVKISNLDPLQGQILKKLDNKVILKNKIRLFLCLIKGDKLDFVIQKATELGVSDIYLIKSMRSIINIDKKDITKKISRYQKIIDMASSQCQRNDIPILKDIIDLKNIDKSFLCDVNLLANENYKGSTLNTYDILKNINDKSVSIFIGPEGGFDPKEITYLEELGFLSISLGNRILRSDTASLYILSILSFLGEIR